MFNNRFNSSKNDPLLEAVKAARADGDARRLAESMANDLFGVFSRKAVVREYLSDYDYALEEAYKCVKEEDKMATKDWDGDKKIETEKKEIWGRRLRAAKASGKYKGPVDEKKMWEAEDSSDGLPPSDAAKQAAKQTSTPSSTPSRTGNAAGSTISNARAATGMNEAQLDELSRTTLKSYVKKANRQANDLERKVNTRKDKPGEEDKMYRRIDGVNLAHDKMKVRVAATNEEALDEATRKHFRQHAADIAKISDQGERNKAASAAADTYARLNPRFDHAKFHAAAGSTAHQEPKKMNEAAYSAKAAREGKDIGKPGKMFSKIAKKAGEKYGSEERGKKVAGAILAKIRAKHMKEENLSELSAFGSAFAAARKSGQSNFSFGGKSFNTKLASSPSATKPSTSSGPQDNPGLRGATGFPRRDTTPAPVGKRDFATTLGRDVGSGPTIKPDAPKPSVSKYDFTGGRQGSASDTVTGAPKVSSTPEPTSPSSTPTPSTPSVERGGSPNPPTTSGDPTPVGSGAITQDAQKAQATTQDAGTPKPSARLQRIGESVDVGSNKYRIV